MEYVFGQDDRKLLEEQFFKLGLEEKVKRQFKLDFRKRTSKFPTSQIYPYFSKERKIESVERVFYTGNVKGMNNINTLLLIGEYYESGMTHEFIIFHNGNFPSTHFSTYLYKDELEKNSESQSKEFRNVIANPAKFDRISFDVYGEGVLAISYLFGSVCDTKKLIQEYVTPLKRDLLFCKEYGHTFILNELIDFDRTTPMFKGIFKEHFLNERLCFTPHKAFSERELKEQEIYAKEIWEELTK